MPFKKIRNFFSNLFTTKRKKLKREYEEIERESGGARIDPKVKTKEFQKTNAIAYFEIRRISPELFKYYKKDMQELILTLAETIVATPREGLSETIGSRGERKFKREEKGTYKNVVNKKIGDNDLTIVYLEKIERALDEPKQEDKYEIKVQIINNNKKIPVIEFNLNREESLLLAELAQFNFVLKLQKNGN